MTGIFESIAGSKLAAMLGTAMSSDAGKNVLQHVVPSFWNRAADEAAWGTVKSYLSIEQQGALEMLLAPMSKSQRAWLRQVVGNMDVITCEKPVSIMGADGKEKTVMRQKRDDRRVKWLRSLADRILSATDKEAEVRKVLSALESDGHYIADPIGDKIFREMKTRLLKEDGTLNISLGNGIMPEFLYSGRVWVIAIAVLITVFTIFGLIEYFGPSVPY